MCGECSILSDGEYMSRLDSTQYIVAHCDGSKVVSVPTSAAALMSGEPSMPTEKECNLPQPFTRVSPRS